MPKYLFEAVYTAEGLSGLEKDGGVAREAAIRSGVENAGGKLEWLYFALGERDAIGVMDMPDIESVAAWAMMGSISHSSECRMRPARDEAAEPDETDAGISFKPCAAPARKMPSVGLSIGRSLGWYSMNHPPGLWVILSTELTVSTSGCGTAAWLSMTMSYSCSTTLPSAISSECTNKL